MQFRVLGPVGARDGDGEDLDLGGPQQRLVLALLLSHSGSVVSTDRLIDDIWGDEPPSTARKTIQGYVSGLRRSLGSSDVLASREPGYLLDIADARVDALEFEGLVSSAREQLAADPERGRAMLREALDMWRGAPYEDHQDVDALRPEITRLEELRVVVLEDRIHADIVCGDASLVVPEVERLVQAHPLREELRVLLALALYRSGRQAEALRAIDGARRFMAEEIGLDPSPRMALLERRILDQDDVLGGRAPLAPDGLTPAPVPEQPARNPYRGLRAFTEDDAADFFGRDELARRLRVALEGRGGPRLVMLAGPSGSGKSSVVRAGLAPALIEEGRTVATMYPGAQPALALAGEVAALEAGASVLVIDQFEEVFTIVSDPGERRAFLTALAELVTDPQGPWVVATIRADHLDELLGHPELAPLLDAALMLVPPMSEHEVRAAVVGPAQRVGVVVEPDLVAEITADVASRVSALPLLQYSLTDLFDRREGGSLTRDAYRAAGGLLGALAGRADELYETLDEAGKVSARRALLRMVTISADGEPVRRRIAQSDLEDLPHADRIFDLFGSHRLLTFDRSPAGEPTVEVAHEALLRDWPRLHDWIDGARLDLVAHRRLAEAAAEWDSANRSDDYLLTGTRLAQYGDWPPSDVSLTLGERAFLDASRAQAADRGRTRRRRRRIALAATAAAAVISTVLAGFALQGQREADRERRAAEQSREEAEQAQAEAERSAAAAEQSREEAEQAQAEAERSAAAAEQSQAAAEARALANAALLQIGEDPERALLLAVEAYAADPDQVVPLLGALGAATARGPVLNEAGYDEGLVTGDLAFIGFHDGSGPTFQADLCAVELGPGRFVTQTGDEAVVVDVPGRSVTRIPASYVCRATASPDGDRLIGERPDPGGGIHIIDATTGRELVAVDPTVGFAAWGADGRILATDGENTSGNAGPTNRRGELLWVDPQTGSVAPTGLMARYIGWSPDASRVLVTDADERPLEFMPPLVRKTIHDSSDLAVVAEIGEVEPASATTAWSGDGRYVGDVSRSGVVRVWDATTGATVVNRTTGEDAVDGAWLAFSPGGDLAALARRRGEVTFFALPTGQPIGSPVLFSEEIAAISFVDDAGLAVVRATGIVEVVDPATNPLIDASIDFSTVAGSLGEAEGDASGGLRLLPDRGDYVTRRSGSDVTVVDLRNEEQWVVRGVAGTSLGRWVRTDGSLVLVLPGFEMVVYDRSGTELARGLPFGSVERAERFELVTLDGDTVVAVVVTGSDQFGNPTVLTTGSIDLNTLETAGTPVTFELSAGSTDFYIGPTRVVEYNFGRGTIRSLALDGTEAGPVVEPGFEVDRGMVSEDGAWALLGGSEMTAVVDLAAGRVVSSAPVGLPAGGGFLPGNRAVFALADGRLGLWALDPLELIGILSERDPAATTSVVAFDAPSHVWFDTGSTLERITIDPARWVSLACDLAGRSLTEDEWARFASSDRPYEPAC